LVIFLLVPEVHDGAEATLVKHRRLAEVPGQRIVLIGGSNLGFGVDSDLLERKTGCPAVNMGMNGYLGVSFLLEETRPFLRRGDIVVIAFEYDGYFKSAYGTGTAQLAVVKARPASLSYLDFSQRFAVMTAVPYAAQKKVLRLIHEAMISVSPSGTISTSTEESATALLSRVESVAGLNDKGDVIAHLEVNWPYELEDGVDATSTPRNKDVISLIRKFTESLRDQGVDVLVSYTPIVDDYYRRHAGPIDALYSALRKAEPIVALGPPSRYVFERGMMFDTVYHLNAQGRRLRTERLAGDIARHYKRDRVCGELTGVNQVLNEGSREE
jgi:hypothetical protein